MKKIAAIIIALALSGCATGFGSRIGETISAVANFTVTQGQVDTARATYDGTSLTSMRRYALLPRCKTGQTISISVPCHDRKLLKQWRKTDSLIERLFVDTQASIDNGNNKGAVTAYNLLMDTIEIAKSFIGKSGVDAT